MGKKEGYLQKGNFIGSGKIMTLENDEKYDSPIETI